MRDGPIGGHRRWEDQHAHSQGISFLPSQVDFSPLGKYPIADLAKPQLRSAMEAWLADLAESGKLAPKTARSIGSLMRLIFRRVVKWGTL